MKTISQKRAFTLIELLVVIAIIGILSVVVLSTLSDARVRAQDAKRIATVVELEKALMLYYDEHGRYPAGGTYGVSNWHGNTSFNDRVANQLTKYADFDFSTPEWGPYWNAGDPNVGYQSAVADDYQTYGIFVTLMSPSNTDLQQNDNGQTISWYEVGELPKYCSSQYSGTDARWWHEGTTLCVGGN